MSLVVDVGVGVAGDVVVVVIVDGADSVLVGVIAVVVVVGVAAVVVDAVCLFFLLCGVWCRCRRCLYCC